jgi:hypothetical protein
MNLWATEGRLGQRALVAGAGTTTPTGPGMADDVISYCTIPVVLAGGVQEMTVTLSLLGLLACTLVEKFGAGSGGGLVHSGIDTEGATLAGV